MIKTLSNLKVVSLTTAAAGPTCDKLLAEYGADVILVEPVNGIANRDTPQYDFMNLHKKSIGINLKSDEGKEIMHRLLQNADVFVSNYRQRGLKGLGLDYDSLKEKYPTLIHATVTGYGEKGEMKDDAGFDATAFWGRAGLAHDMTQEDAPLMIVPSGVGDIICGTTLALGVVSALNYRNQTGKGMKVYISLLGLGLYVNFSQLILYQYGVKFPKNRLHPQRALSNTYPCKDGWIYLLTLNWEKDFWNLLKVLGREDLVGDPRWNSMKDTEDEKAPELRKILEDEIQKYTMAEMKEMLSSIDMACGIFSSGGEALKDPQAIANSYLMSMVNGDGKEITVPCSPIKFGDDAPVETGSASELGEDTIEILKNYGYTETEIDSLVQSRIVAVKAD